MSSVQVCVNDADETAGVNIGTFSSLPPSLTSSSTTTCSSTVNVNPPRDAAHPEENDTLSSVTTSTIISASSTTGTADHASYQYIFLYTSRGRLLCVRWPHFTLVWQTVLIPEGWESVAYSSSSECHTEAPHTHQQRQTSPSASRSHVTPVHNNEDISSAERPQPPPALSSLLHGWGALVPAPQATCSGPPPKPFRHSEHYRHSVSSPHGYPLRMRGPGSGSGFPPSMNLSSVGALTPHASLHTAAPRTYHATGWSVSATSSGAARRISSMSAVEKSHCVATIRHDTDGTCCWASIPSSSPCWGPFTWWHRRRPSGTRRIIDTAKLTNHSSSANRNVAVDHPASCRQSNTTGNTSESPHEEESRNVAEKELRHLEAEEDEIRGPVSNWKRKRRNGSTNHIMVAPFALSNFNNNNNNNNSNNNSTRKSIPDNKEGGMMQQGRNGEDGDLSEASDATHTAPPTPSPHPVQLSSTTSSWTHVPPIRDGTHPSAQPPVSFISLAEVLSTPSSTPALGSVVPSTEVPQRFGASSPPPLSPKVSLSTVPLQQFQELYVEISLQEGAVLQMFPPPVFSSAFAGEGGRSSTLVCFDAEKAARSRRIGYSGGQPRCVEEDENEGEGGVHATRTGHFGIPSAEARTVSKMSNAFPSMATVHLGLRFQVQQTCVMATASCAPATQSTYCKTAASDGPLQDLSSNNKTHHGHHHHSRNASRARPNVRTTSTLWLRTCALEHVKPTVYLSAAAKPTFTTTAGESPAWEGGVDQVEDKEESHFFSSSTSSISSSISSSSSSFSLPSSAASSSTGVRSRATRTQPCRHPASGFAVPPLPLADLIQCYPHGIQAHYRTEDLLSLSMKTTPSAESLGTSGKTGSSSYSSKNSCLCNDEEAQEENVENAQNKIPVEAAIEGGGGGEIPTRSEAGDPLNGTSSPGAALPKLLSSAQGKPHLFWPLPSSYEPKSPATALETQKSSRTREMKSSTKTTTTPHEGNSNATVNRGGEGVEKTGDNHKEKESTFSVTRKEVTNTTAQDEIQNEEAKEGEGVEEEVIVQAFFFRLTFVPQNSTAPSAVPSGTPSVVYRAKHKGAHISISAAERHLDPVFPLSSELGLGGHTEGGSGSMSEGRVHTPEKLQSGTSSCSSSCQGPAAVCWDLWALPVLPPPSSNASTITPTISSSTFSSPPAKELQKPASFHLTHEIVDVRGEESLGLLARTEKRIGADAAPAVRESSLHALQARPCVMLGPRQACAKPRQKHHRGSKSKKERHKSNSNTGKRKAKRGSLGGTWTPMQASHHFDVAKRPEWLRGVWWCLGKTENRQSGGAVGGQDQCPREMDATEEEIVPRSPPKNAGDSARGTVSLIYSFPATITPSSSELHSNGKKKDPISTKMPNVSVHQRDRSSRQRHHSNSNSSDEWKEEQGKEDSIGSTKKKRNSRYRHDEYTNPTSNENKNSNNNSSHRGKRKSPLHWMRSSLEPGRSASAPYHHSSGFSGAANSGDIHQNSRNPVHRTPPRHPERRRRHDHRYSSMNSGSVGVPRWSTSIVENSFLEERAGGGSFRLPMASASTFSESPEQSNHHRGTGSRTGILPSPSLPHPVVPGGKDHHHPYEPSRVHRKFEAGSTFVDPIPSDPAVTQTDDGGYTTLTTSPAADMVGSPAGFTSPSTAMCTTASQSFCPSPVPPIDGPKSPITLGPQSAPTLSNYVEYSTQDISASQMKYGAAYHVHQGPEAAPSHYHTNHPSNQNHGNNAAFTMSYFEQNFEPLRLLGRGAYGAAILSRHRMSGKYYAVKVLLVHDYESEKDVLQEVRVHAALDCKYLVHYHNSWSEIITPQRAMELSSIGVVPKQQKSKALWKAYQGVKRHRPRHEPTTDHGCCHPHHHHHRHHPQQPHSTHSRRSAHESALVLHRPSSYHSSSMRSAGSLTPYSCVTPATTFRGYASPIAPQQRSGSSGYGSPRSSVFAVAMGSSGERRTIVSPPPQMRRMASATVGMGVMPQLVSPSASSSPVRPQYDEFTPTGGLPHTWSYILEDDDDDFPGAGYLQGTEDDEEEEEEEESSDSSNSNSSASSTSTSSATTWGRTPRDSSSTSSRSDPKTKKTPMTQPASLPSQSLVLLNMRAVFIQMQLCQLTLAELLGNRKAIDRIENLVILLQLCTGLLYLHDRGILHRDVKPTNIFLDYSGRFTAVTTLSEEEEEEVEEGLLEWATAGRFGGAEEANNNGQNEDSLAPLVGVGKNSTSYHHIVRRRHSHQQVESPLLLYTAAFCGTGRFPSFAGASSAKPFPRRAYHASDDDDDDDDEEDDDDSFMIGGDRGGGLASFCGLDGVSEVTDGRFCSSLARLSSFASPNASSVFSPSVPSPRQFVMPQLPPPWVAAAAVAAGASLTDASTARAGPPSEATRAEIRELLRTMRAGPGEDTPTFIRNHREELLRRWQHRLHASGAGGTSGASQVHQGSRLLARWLMRHLVHAMLGDFGLAKLHVQQRPQFLEGGMIFSMKDANTKGVGSPLYASPEQLRGDICTCASDAFSLALVMAEMYLLPTTTAERLDVLQKTRTHRYPTSDVMDKYPELSVIFRLTLENPMARLPLRSVRKYLLGMLQKCLSDELNSYVRGA